MALNNDDVMQILKLLDESDYDDVRLEIGDVKIHFKKRSGRSDNSSELPKPHAERVTHKVEPDKYVPQIAKQNSSQSRTELDLEGLVAIRAPMLGTFFCAPSPGEKPFVEVGSEVSSADTVCLVEVMKLFNSVKAGVAGTVLEVLVENGSMVEFDQVLMLIKPK